MTAPANRWKLGLFVLAGCASGIAVMTWVGVRELQKESHPVYAYFDEAVTGLESGSPVKYRGVTVGVVDDIGAAPDKRHLEVRFALYDDKLARLGLDVQQLDGEKPLPGALRAQIVMSWVTGTSFVQVDFFPDAPTGPQQVPFPLDPQKHVLRTVPSAAKSLEDASRDVLRVLPDMAKSANELVSLLRTELQGVRLPEVSRQLQELLQRTNRLLDDVEKRGVVGEGVATLDAWENAAKAVADAAGSLRDEQSPVGQAIADVRKLIARLDGELAAARAGETAAALRGASASFTALSADVQGELAQLRRTLVSIEQLMALLERDPGALLRGRSAASSPLQEQKR
jgi:ABC-type transporter Mla subunit MlaD